MTPAPPAMVLIGRNEGPRLKCALEALHDYPGQVIYVDSDSSDDSVATANTCGADVIELDPSTPLNAARGRNAGYRRALDVDPSLRYVQFIDGDCEMDPGWADIAVRAMEDDPAIAVVCGRLHERRVGLNAYHRLLDQEWQTPVGEVASSGGIAMMRVAMLEEVGLFNPTIRVGEEPELCMRLRAHGGKIVRLADTMAYHDADMTRFSQWWARCRRNGRGGLDVYWRTRHGEKLYAGILRRTLIWTVGWLGLWGLSVAVFGLLLGPVAAAVAGLAIVLIQPMQYVRLAIRQSRRGLHWLTASQAALFQMVDKWAQLHGMVGWVLARLTGAR